MAISDGEKLIIGLLSDIHRSLSIKDGLDPDFIQDAVAYGDTWALKSRYPGIFGDNEERDPDKVEFVHDALTMWGILESTYADLEASDQEKIQASAGANGSAPKFEGFDGHTELVSIARTMIEKLGMYDEFAGRNLDAHYRNTEVHGGWSLSSKIGERSSYRAAV